MTTYWKLFSVLHSLLFESSRIFRRRGWAASRCTIRFIPSVLPNKPKNAGENHRRLHRVRRHRSVWKRIFCKKPLTWSSKAKELINFFCYRWFNALKTLPRKSSTRTTSLSCKLISWKKICLESPIKRIFKWKLTPKCYRLQNYSSIRYVRSNLFRNIIHSSYQTMCSRRGDNKTKSFWVAAFSWLDESIEAAPTMKILIALAVLVALTSAEVRMITFRKLIRH